jgi:hypothetical protein
MMRATHAGSACDAFTTGRHTIGVVSACLYAVPAALALAAFRKVGDPTETDERHEEEMA